jgi:hypothetical protein
MPEIKEKISEVLYEIKPQNDAMTQLISKMEVLLTRLEKKIEVF